MRSRGFTAVELMAVVAVLAIIAMLAAPSLTTLLAKRRIEGVTTELVTDLHYARSEAVQRNAPVYVQFGPHCYVIHAAEPAASAPPTGQCFSADPSTVSAGTLLKTVQVFGTTVDFIPTGGPGTRFQFEPQRGSAIQSGTVNVDSSVGGYQLRAVVTPLGRASTCSPNTSMSGYPAC